MSYQANDYSKKQAIKDAAYAREYRAWFAAQPPEEQRRLTALGLAEPLRETDGYGNGSMDAAESHEASETPDLPLEDDELPVRVSAIENEEVLDILRRLIGELMAEPKRPPQPRVPRPRHGVFLPRRHDDRHRPPALRHARGGEQTLRRTHRKAEPPAVARHALFDSPPRLSGGPTLNPQEP